MTDRYGTLWTNLPAFPEEIGKDLSDRDWYKGTSSNWKPYTSTVYRLIVGDKPPAVAVCVPIFDEKARPIGILASSQRLGFLDAAIERVPLGPYAAVTVTDRLGKILYSNKLPYQDSITDYRFFPLIESAVKRKRQQIDMDDPQNGRQKSYLTVIPVGDTGWTVIIERSLSDIYRSESGRFIEIAVVSSLLSLVIVFLLVYLRKSSLLKKTEQLIQAEKKFRSLIDGAPDAIVVHVDARFVYLNPAAATLFGAGDTRRLIGSPLIERVAPNYREAIQERLRLLYQERIKLPAFEQIYLRLDGSSFPVEVHEVPIDYDNRNAALTFVRDITERKRAEEALRESESRYRLLAENATDAIWTVGMDMQLTYVSPSVTKLLGFTVEEAMARTAQEAYTPAAFEKATQVFAEEMANEEKADKDPARSRMLELALFRKDGSTVPVEGHFRFIRDPEGKAISILAIMRDISEHKRMEEALRQSEKRYRELSIIDDLTQLYNSRHFYHQLKMEIDRSVRYRQPLTLMLLDLDDFKRYNDAYGHIEGDQVLLRLGQVVRRCLRQTDSAYRYGGEEFTVLLPMTTRADAAVIGERIRTEFKKETFSPVPGRNVHATVSIGVAQYTPNEEAKDFIHRVDLLMYRGKQNGKDSVCTEPPSGGPARGS